jgi:hypothetical protein
MAKAARIPIEHKMKNNIYTTFQLDSKIKCKLNHQYSSFMSFLKSIGTVQD